MSTGGDRARLPTLDELLGRIDRAVDEHERDPGPDHRRPGLVADLDDAGQDTNPHLEPRAAPASAASFRGGCPCLWHVAWRSLTGHGQWAALAPLRHRRRRP